MTYHPQAYELAQSRIEDFPVSGPVSVEPIVVADRTLTIFDDAVTWNTTLGELNTALSSQLQQEIDRHGRVQGDKAKKLRVSVDSYQGTHPGFIFKMDVVFTVSGDDGFKKTFTVTDKTNGNIGGNIERSFNGSIAISVIHVLQDPEVLGYLKR
jgi:hypothetical protein